jgi:hypothetical protein
MRSLSPDNETIYCYAQRLLNPFRGVTNIVRYQSAEAVTMDGVHWDIYVANDALRQGLDATHSIQISDIRYGSWSRHQGLKRGPIVPSDEFRRLEYMGDVAYDHLLEVGETTPFELRDQYEYWLLDQHGQPLALLNSAVFEDDIDPDQLIDWRAGQDCLRTFRTTRFDDDRIVPQAAGSTSSGVSSAGAYLTRYINALTGEPPAAQWFYRNEAGEGEAMQGANVDASLRKRTLAAEHFPVYFVGCADEAHAELVTEFNEWQAPWLLLLANLTASERWRLEQQARKRALEVDKQHRLYPAVADASAIRAARVEAMMRRSQPVPVSQEEILSTYYIELNPGPTD